MLYAKINKVQARKLYDSNETVLVVGDNVNSFHFENGWHLTYIVTKTDIDKREDGWTFDKLVRNFEWYLDRELGRRAAYYVRQPLTNNAFELLKGKYTTI